jgi:hypothetical protein
LLIPFCYEYLRQRNFQLKKLRLDVLTILLVPLGTGLFALYCVWRFGDVLAFSHVQATWSRQLQAPWWGLVTSFFAIKNSGALLKYQALHNLLDFLPSLLILGLIVLSLVGPWRFPRTHLSYVLYAAALYLFFNLNPINWDAYPLQSQGRYVLEIFPAFIVLATLGKYKMVHQIYILVATAMLFLLLTLFLKGHWII